MHRMAGPTAALAGVPVGVQGRGVWTGRRQLFVRFAAEAETAVMYTASALASELERMVARAPFHSVALSGRDVLGNADFLRATLEAWEAPIPVMLDTDGQRPEALEPMLQRLALVQVLVDCATNDAGVDRALETLGVAARGRCSHALVLCPREDTSDAQLLRIVEQAHAVSGGTMIVVHPGSGQEGQPLDRRWTALLERAAALHPDIRLVIPLLPPLGMH